MLHAVHDWEVHAVVNHLDALASWQAVYTHVWALLFPSYPFTGLPTSCTA